jgi:hypothetical protein
MLSIGDMLGMGADNGKALDITQPHLLRFDVDSSGYVSSSINNRKVYRNKDSEDCIRAGECWLCTLSFNTKGNNYFASGLRIMDLEDIVPLGESIISELAEYLLDYAPSSVERICMPSMEGKVATMVEERLGETSKAYEDRIASLESEISGRDSRIEELEKTVEELENTIGNLETEAVKPNVEVATIPTFSDSMVPEGVMRLSDNELCSKSFEEGCYRVRFSINGRRMTISKDSEGEIRCRNNILCIPHLEAVLPFNGPCRMIHKEMDGGMTVSLI